MRVVLDTSVLVAAARSAQGASSKLLDSLASRLYEPAISIPLFCEYRAVLLRPQNRAGRPIDEVEDFLDSILTASHLQEIFFNWRPALADADDDLVLELAIAANARYIITHNLRDFRGCEEWGISALSPGEFLRSVLNLQ